MNWIEIGTVSDIPRRGARVVKAQPCDIAVFRTGNDEIYATWDRCPHAGMPLALMGDRFLPRESDLILCSSHGALFRIDDGRCVAGPCEGRPLWPWPVEVIDGEVRAA